MWMHVAHTSVFVPGLAPVTPVTMPVAMGRYTRFGWRLGHADGPWRTAEGARCREGEALVAHPGEQRMLKAILSDCDGTGSSAHALARAFREAGMSHPRTLKPWAAGSIVMIYATHKKQREAALLDLIATALQ